MDNALTRKLPESVEQTLFQAGEEAKNLLNKPELRDRLMLAIWEQVRRSTQLQRSDPNSLLNSILQMTRLNLDPVLPNECYLIPYKGEVRLILGYAGLMKLARRSPEVVDIQCHAVYENDTYEEKQIDEPPYHRRPPKFAPRGRTIGFYAVAKLVSGRHHVVTMSVDEIKQHRQRYSRSAKNEVWDNNFDAMALKTVLRQLCHPRHLPMSAEINEVLRNEEALYATTQASLSSPERVKPVMSQAEGLQAAVSAAEDLFGDGGSVGLQRGAINRAGADQSLDQGDGEPKPEPDPNDWNAPVNLGEGKDQANDMSPAQYKSILGYLAKYGVVDGDKRILLGHMFHNGVNKQQASDLISDFKEIEMLPAFVLRTYVDVLRARAQLTIDDVAKYCRNHFEGKKAQDLDAAQQKQLIAWLVIAGESGEQEAEPQGEET